MLRLIRFSGMFILFLCSNLYSQDRGIAFFTYGVPQFIRTNDARGSSMGMTGVAGSQGICAPFTNPAGFAGKRGVEILAAFYPSREILFSEAADVGNQETIGLSVTLPRQWRIAAYFTTIDYGTFTDDEDDDVPAQNYSINQYMASVSKNFGNIAVGTNIRYTDQELAAFSGTALVFDIGVKYRKSYTNPSRGLGWHTLGASISNLGSDFVAKSGSSLTDPLPQMVRLGVAWGSDNNDKEANGNLEYNAALEYQQVLNTSDYTWNHIGAGLELVFFKYMFGNFGYHFDLNGKNHRTFAGKYQGPTYGLGFRTPQPLSYDFPLTLEARYARSVQPGKLEIESGMISFRAHYPFK